MISHAELLLADGRYDEVAPITEALAATRPPETHPLWSPWRCLRARAAAGEGDRETASRLAGEELELARRSAAPWVVGRALRQYGELTGDRGGVARGGRAAGRDVGAAGAREGARGARQPRRPRSQRELRRAAPTGWRAASLLPLEDAISASSAASSSIQPLEGALRPGRRGRQAFDLAVVDVEVEIDVAAVRRPS